MYVNTVCVLWLKESVRLSDVCISVERECASIRCVYHDWKRVCVQTMCVFLLKESLRQHDVCIMSERECASRRCVCVTVRRRSTWAYKDERRRFIKKAWCTRVVKKFAWVIARVYRSNLTAELSTRESVSVHVYTSSEVILPTAELSNRVCVCTRLHHTETSCIPEHSQLSWCCNCVHSCS